MKKLELKGMQMLTKEQMKNVIGGVASIYACGITQSNGNFAAYDQPANNAEAAQAACDAICWNYDWCVSCDCSSQAQCDGGC